MPKSRIVLLAIIFYTMLHVFAAAQDAAGKPKPGPANAEFQKVFAEWKVVVGELGALRAKYRTASKEERPEIEKQWKEVAEKGNLMKPKLIEAAEKAFAEAPKADPQIADLLMDIFYLQMALDDFENADRIGKLMLDNDFGDAKTASYVGIAAACTGDFDTASKYLGKANKEGYYKLRNSDDSLFDHGKTYLATFNTMKTNWDNEQKIREAEAKAGDLPRVLIKTSKGDIEVELFENEAPNTVANFITLVEKGFYNGLTFHRVLEQFMAQGGCPNGDGRGGPGYMIPCECYQPNRRLHFRGSLSMANAGRDTNGSQFFITFMPTPSLDGKHTVFGRVIKGFDVLAKIQRRNPEDANAPDPDKIIEAKVLRKRPHEYVVKKTGEK
jgi:cyclophilin family peptidyl-prolyl cis-trans isomerase